MKRIYLDYAASTPLAPEVKNTLVSYLKSNKNFGNPSSLHFFGQKEKAIIDESRELIAQKLGAQFEEIIFTAGATEANNLALQGVVKGFKKFFGRNIYPRLIVSAIEHSSVLETASALEKENVEVVFLPVDKNGFVNLAKLKEALNERTILVSIMYVNNEIGTIEPIKEISEIIQEFKTRFKTPNTSESPKNIIQRSESSKNIFVNSDKFVVWDRYPLFHTDAVQALQYLNVDVNELNVDLMTLSAHKIYGPKGIGLLYIKRPKMISPLIFGGPQEFNYRPGTENVLAISGFATAIKTLSFYQNKELKRISDLSFYFLKGLKKIYPRLKINGFPLKSNKRLPHILNISFEGRNNRDLLIKFDLNNLAISTGSACHAGSFKDSFVLKAMGLSQSRIKSALRFSFGRFLTFYDIKEALKRIKKLL